MTDLKRQKTILSLLKEKNYPFPLPLPKSVERLSENAAMVGKQLGWVKIIRQEKLWTSTWNGSYVLCQCMGCQTIKWINYGNLRRGISKGCQHCSQPRKVPLWLDRRLTAAKQRCVNPDDPAYARYGARGIEFRFESVLEAGLYLLALYPSPNCKLQLDRIDNNGHYERGNLRLVEEWKNKGNRQITVLSEWDQIYWPYARSVVTRKLSAGQTRDAVIQEARTAVEQKRKNWRVIDARLTFMTYEMPDQITVLPYRASSCTTVATAAERAH